MRSLRFEIRLPIGPDWRNIELTRSAILNCIAAVFHDTSMGQSISVVAGELLENAVKYGDWAPQDDADDAPDSMISLRVKGDRRGVVVEVENPVSPESKSLAQLFALLKKLNSYSSPREAFQARLRELAENPDGDNSQLGLARVCYESQATLAARVDEGVLSVIAECPPEER